MKNIKMILVMMIWGSIAVFSRWLDLSPVVLAFMRALIAIPVIWGIVMLRKKNVLHLMWRRENGPIYVSGVLIGLAWVLLFYAYGHTSIANATLTYNMAPIYVLLLSKWFLKEDLSVWDVVMVLVSFTGILIIVVHSINVNIGDLKAIGASSLAGVLYSIIIILNRKFSNVIEDDVKTLIQLMMACIILLPMAMLNNPIQQVMMLNKMQIWLLIILGTVHTGLAFYVYFGSYKSLKAIEIALLGYLEPVFAIFFSITLLNEKLGVYEVIGCLLIIGATLSKDVYQSISSPKITVELIKNEVK